LQAAPVGFLGRQGGEVNIQEDLAIVLKQERENLRKPAKSPVLLKQRRQ
jgi:hypothetical protein